MNCHIDEPNEIFGVQREFIEKFVCSIEDAVPESIKQEKKKNKGIVYLPGEKLLIELNKQKKKATGKLDIKRVRASLMRIRV